MSLKLGRRSFCPIPAALPYSKVHNVCLLKDLKLSQHLTFDGRELKRAAALYWKVFEA